MRDVDPDGPATRSGIRPRDRVLALDRVPLTHLYPVYHDRHPGDQVVFTLERAERAVTVPLTLTAPPLREYLIRLEPLLVGWLSGGWVSSLGHCVPFTV